MQSLHERPQNSKIKHHTDKKHSALPIVSSVLIVLAITWIGHFLLYEHFGVYEDDLNLIVPYMDAQFTDIFNYAKSLLANPFKSGRPLSYIIPAIFGSIGMKLGGLPILYLISYLLVVCNALVLFFIIKRTFGLNIAFPGTIIFCLFPADVTKTFLTHGFVIHFSMLFAFIAIYLYLSGWKVSSYLSSVLCLFCYESGILPFFAAPLLKKSKEPLSKKEVAIHWAIILAVVLVVFSLRAICGDRLIGHEKHLPLSGITTPLFVILRSLGGMVFGPLVTITSFPYGVLKTIYRFNLGAGGALVFGSIFVALGFYYLPSCQEEWEEKKLLIKNKLISLSGYLKYPYFDRNLFRAFWVGLLMLPVGYLFSFSRFPLLYLWGRGSRVHFAAVFGAAISGGAVLSFLYTAFQLTRRRILGCMFLGLIVGIFVSYGFVNQQDYVRSWNNQKWFWQRVLDLCPDVAEGTQVFVIDHGLPKETNSIHSIRGWEMPLYFKLFYSFPTKWSTPPRLFIMDSFWTEGLKKKRDTYHWKVPLWSYWEPLNFNNLIILKMENGELIRWGGPLFIDGKEFPLKHLDSNIVDYPKRPLYQFMIENSGSVSNPDFQEESPFDRIYF